MTWDNCHDWYHTSIKAKTIKMVNAIMLCFSLFSNQHHREPANNGVVDIRWEICVHCKVISSHNVWQSLNLTKYSTYTMLPVLQDFAFELCLITNCKAS